VHPFNVHKARSAKLEHARPTHVRTILVNKADSVMSIAVSTIPAVVCVAPPEAPAKTVNVSVTSLAKTTQIAVETVFAFKKSAKTPDVIATVVPKGNCVWPVNVSMIPVLRNNALQVSVAVPQTLHVSKIAHPVPLDNAVPTVNAKPILARV
jgi:hypothetical protein